MANLQSKPRTETWRVASWDDYLRAIADPQYDQAKGYYRGHMRVEMSPVSFDHGNDHVVIILLLVTAPSTNQTIPQP